MNLSIIIPALHEQQHIGSLIAQLRSQDQPCEIIVVDGDPAGSTNAAIADPTVVCLTAPKGRGIQLAAGVAVSTGEIILMLHADTRLPDGGLAMVADAVEKGAAWGAFRLGIEASGRVYRIIERTVDLRCKLFTLPYGDQAIFVTRSALEAVGGIPPIPLMEDVELARRLHTNGFSFALLSRRVCTSARRWHKDGVIRRTLKNWWLLLCYLAGADPHKLLKSYSSH